MQVILQRSTSDPKRPKKGLISDLLKYEKKTWNEFSKILQKIAIAPDDALYY